ncbi:LexA family protein [Pseudoramibacter alactolyticus]|uniref:LexA family protein n=1 Tax=Pseudoramibacter alactolyticus TaxID=113287 RepID=UPI0023545D02|nr:XRE family transcriptional regulator [Pseudoramibacter alactolyticus]MBM6968654.1 helix-turn-helix domain-containing protein [Pseudoramibacter alactolyticus]
MIDLYKNIKKRRQELKISQSKLAEMVGYTNRSSIAKIEAGKIDLPQSKIVEIAEALQTTPKELMGWEDEKSEIKKINWSDNVVPAKINRDVVSIPVLGSVPAGVPVEAIEDIIDTIEIPQEWLAGGAQFIGLKVTGTSMYPMYLEGDTVVIEIKHDCDSGQDAIIYVNGYDATLKTVIKNDDGTITLKPRNPEWPEKTYGPGDDPITILGPVVQMQRNV